MSKPTTAPAPTKSAQRHLEPGDPVPAITLPGRDGKLIALADQLYSGNAQILWIMNDLPGKAEMAQAKKLAAKLKSVEALFFIVVGGQSAPDKKTAKGDVPELFDPKSQVAALFGITAPGIAIIGADGRLSRKMSIDELDQVADHCTALFSASAPEIIRAQAPVLVVDRVLEPELCDRLIQYWQDGEKRADGVSTGSTHSANANTVYKKRNDVVLLDEDLFNDVKDRLIRRVMPELMRAFHFRTASMEALRIGCYDSKDKGFFARHRDNRTEFTAHRRYAVSLNLNDVDYEGGQVRFPEYGRALYTSGPGGAVVFSCSLLHEAMPVTKGKRFAIFTFLTDAAGARQEQEMVARRKQQVAPLAMQKR